ncbi:Crp/Fnr family transcriptional regulator [Paludibacterium paludis]|uniref:Crp/Fnr family transcriptional regulator n=1 Tax=Paludibacterium paludis TaxID=1225769 RepID=A0A918U7V2_9NEIS|nr:Crp/Fnr family transcriptional regulator [Paludibacterium paludis]GGY04684.1 hypothetical protein GCM10011289_04020 [Paludibacterium paludis]
MDKSIVKQWLKDCEFFEGVGDSLLDALADLAVPFTLTKDQVLFAEGEVVSALYILIRGSTRSYSGEAGGKKFVFMFNRPGDALGEVTFLDGGPCAWTTRAEEECQLIMLRQADLADAFGNQTGIPNDLVKDRVMMKLVGMVRYFATAAKHLALLDVYGRIRILFNGMLVEEGGRTLLDTPLTQQEIADRIGSSREMVARILKELIFGRYIEMENRRIVILKMLPDHF